jgi:spermidine synthase
MNDRLPGWSVALVSGAALANEVLLTRYFAVVHWHHFATMMISLALLGFGASGTFVTVARRWLLDRFADAYVVNLLAFGLLAVAAPVAASALPFQAEQLLWDAWQPVWLAFTYLALALPFFCAGNAISLALLQWHTRAGRVYAADLAGAGVGSVLVLGLLYQVPVELALKLVACLGPVAAIVALIELRSRRQAAFAAGAALLLVLAGVPGHWLHADPGEYKALSQALRIPGTRIIETRSSPLGRVDVIQSEQVPLRHAPGLSLMAANEPPPQLGLFTDGDGMDAITAATGDTSRLEFLRESTGALGYQVAAPRSVLVVGAGGGLEVLRARAHGVRRLEAIEFNPQIAALMRREFAEYTGGLLTDPGVKLEVGDVRGMLASHRRRYDLIQISLAGGAAGGLGGLNEDYVHTVEAFELYLSRLNPGGYLSITRYVQVPPRDGLKMLATAIAALRAARASYPSSRLLMIRSWQTVTLLVKKGEVTSEEVARLRRFCETRAFDVAWYPGMPRAAANVYNELREPWFYDGAAALLGRERDQYLADYPFDIRPATDDRPFFRNFFRWPSFAEAWRTRERGGMALLEAGYPVLGATLVQALLAGSLLMLAPLLALRRRSEAKPGIGRVFAYFACIGLAFLFVEVAFLQKLLRFVHHPTIALSVVLATFLLAAGAGSLWTARVSQPGYARRRLVLAVAAIVVVGAVLAIGFDPLLARLDHWSLPVKIAISAALISPLAFLMGMPFPLALREIDPPLVPWAWSINGCASVVSPVLATLLAVDLGFTAVLYGALMLYGLTLAAFPRTVAR